MGRLNLAMPARQIPLTRFGGLFTLADARDLPDGASWLGQDVDYFISSVGIRPGLTPVDAPSGMGQPQWLAEALLGDNTPILTQDELGQLWSWLIGTVSNSPFYTGILNGARALGFGANLREYLCFSNLSNLNTYPAAPVTGLLQGTDQPRQWDGSNLDRISQMGPGVGPTVTKVEGVPAPPTPTLGSTSGGSLPARTAWVVTAYVTATGVLFPSSESSIALAANTLLVVNSPPSATGATGWNAYVSEDEAGAETLQNTTPIAIGTNWTEAATGITTTGNAAPTQQVAAGPRYAILFYLTRSGYLTPASPPSAFSTDGSTTGLTFSNLSIGPANVLQRILAWTPANAAIGGPYFYVRGNVTDPNGSLCQASIVADNTTTSLTINISDQVLQEGIAVATEGNNLFDVRELGEPVKGCQYSGRTFFIGCRNKCDEFLNTTFDGGGSAANPIGGWTPASPDSGVQQKLVTSPVFGLSYYFKNGGTGEINRVTPGQAFALPGDNLSQPAAQTAFGTPILTQGRAYGARATISSPANNPPGQVWIGFYSPSLGTGWIAAIDGTALGAKLKEFTLPIIPYGGSGAYIWNVIPSDLILYVAGTNINPGCDFLVDRIEIFDWNQPVLQNQVICSYGGQPEAFDGETGEIDISEFTTEPITNIFRFLNQLYICTANRWFATQDNGSTEPDDWTLNEVSNAVGCLGPMTEDVGEEFVLCADLRGLWLFDGGSHMKLSQEVQDLWDSIDFDYATGFWLRNDRHRQRILFGSTLPTPGDWTLLPEETPEQNNVILLCSYLTLAPGSTIAVSPGVSVSMFTGQLISREGGRKWAVWSIPSWYGEWIPQPDGSEELWLGSAAENKIYLLDPAAKTDDGAAIPQAYGTSNFSDTNIEQAMQLGSVRKVYGPVSILMDVVGKFVLTVLPETPKTSTPVVLPPLGGESPAQGDTVLPISVPASRVFLLFETDGKPGSSFQVCKIVMGAQPHPRVPIGGRLG